MKAKSFTALSLRGKVITAIVVLQVAMISVFVSVQLYHEVRMAREHIRDTNAHFASNLAHAFGLLVYTNNLPFLQRCVDIALKGEDIRYVAVRNNAGSVLASGSKDPEAFRWPARVEAASLSPAAAAVGASDRGGWFSLFSPTTYEISVPLKVAGRQEGWVLVGVSTARMDRKVWAGAMRGLGIGGFALGVIGLLGFFVDRRLKSIFRELTRVTRKMAEGDLAQRVNISTGDELEQLGETFNRMADRLASSQELLRRWAQDLEVKVKERTQDLEEEKQKLDGIVSGIGAGLVLVDKELKVLWANRIATDWFGPLGRLRGEQCFSALWGETNICQECAAVKALHSGNVEHGEKVIPGENGERRFFQITASAIRNSAGEIIQIVELIQDVTEKKELEVQLLQAGKMVAMGELASGIAHEINNPLAVIGANAERMGHLFSRRHFPPEKLAEKFPSYLEPIVRHTYRCKEIIEKLLNFARQRDVDLQSTDINMVLEESVALLSHRASTENRRIVRNLNPALPLLFSDPNGLQQVFLNILSNAMDATEGIGEIHVTSRVAPGFVEVEIADTGRGIAPENIDRIFQPFFTTKPPGKGTGLGLSICSRILSRLGGQITVRSTPGEGTRFCVALPIEANPATKIQESDLWRSP